MTGVFIRRSGHREHRELHTEEGQVKLDAGIAVVLS